MIRERIRENLGSMSPSFQEIGRWLLDNYDAIGFSSVHDLSKTIGVSNASLVRYTQALGFKGYKQFREAVQEEVKTKLHPGTEVTLNELDLLPVKKQLQRLAENEINNLSKTLKDINVQSLLQMVEGVFAANRIFISGFGVSKNIMQIFEYALTCLQIKDVHGITGSISDYSPKLHTIKENDSLFILTTVMSRNFSDFAVVDAGVKAGNIDQAMPTVWEQPGLTYVSAADEHGAIKVATGGNAPHLGERLRLVPGHCDPTVNLHDWIVGVRDGTVEALWPVAARGALL